jgi:phosphotransferase system enzyme I (PtsI)
MRLNGVGVSPGRASGPVVRVAEPLSEPAASPVPTDLHAEAARIRPASERVAAGLKARAKTVEGQPRAVLETTAVMATDLTLLSQAERLVTKERVPAARAVHEAASGFIANLHDAGGYMAERARDVEDVRNRLVADLLGVPVPGVPELTVPSVLVARDVAPAETAGLDPAVVLALVTEEGGPASHTAILTRALGIPAVVACRGVLDLDAESLTVDGETGVVETFPGAGESGRAQGD